MTTAAEKIEQQLAHVSWLRGRGPVSYDYGKWVDKTHHVLVTVFGEGSPEAEGFLEIVGEGAEARGWGLPLAPQNPWGMQARLNRCEQYLEALLAEAVGTGNREQGTGEPGQAEA
jgi:hypothetical protein